MIVEPGFLGHWKTKLFESLLHDPLGHTYIMRLWGHCQERRRWFIQDEQGYEEIISAVCGYDGNSKEFTEILFKCGFIEKKKRGIYVHDWEKVNVGLVTAWNNGKYGRKGGRPRKTRKVSVENPPGYEKHNSENPDAPPIRLDQIGLDEIRQEGNGNEGERAREPEVGAVFRFEKTRPRDEAEVIEYFRTQAVAEPEQSGRIAFLHYNGKDWRVEGAPIHDWKAKTLHYYLTFIAPKQRKERREEQLDAQLTEVRSARMNGGSGFAAGGVASQATGPPGEVTIESRDAANGFQPFLVRNGMRHGEDWSIRRDGKRWIFTGAGIRNLYAEYVKTPAWKR